MKPGKMPKYKNIDEYISHFSGEIQVILERLRRVIQESAPEATEAISYGMPTFKQNGNLVHFAAHKHHIGFYPAPSGIAAFKKELAAYKTSKGALQFPLDKPVPYKLVEEIVRFRVKEARDKNKRG